MKKNMPDTLKIVQMVHDTLYIKGAEGLDVLNKTDAFYNNAWNKLIIFWTILAIVVPAVISWFQKQSLKNDSVILKKEIKDEILKTRDELKAEIRLEFQSELAKFEKIIETQKFRSDSGIYFVQAVNQLREKDYSGALLQFIRCALSCENGGNFHDFKKALINISNHCLPNLSEEEITSKYFPDWRKELTGLFERISGRDDLKDIHILIAKITSMLDKLPKTKGERLARN